MDYRLQSITSIMDVDWLPMEIKMRAVRIITRLGTPEKEAEAGGDVENRLLIAVNEIAYGLSEIAVLERRVGLTKVKQPETGKPQ